MRLNFETQILQNIRVTDVKKTRAALLNICEFYNLKNFNKKQILDIIASPMLGFSKSLWSAQGNPVVG